MKENFQKYRITVSYHLKYKKRNYYTKIIYILPPNY